MKFLLFVALLGALYYLGRKALSSGGMSVAEAAKLLEVSPGLREILPGDLREKCHDRPRQRRRHAGRRRGARGAAREALGPLSD